MCRRGLYAPSLTRPPHAAVTRPAVMRAAPGTSDQNTLKPRPYIFSTKKDRLVCFSSAEFFAFPRVERNHGENMLKLTRIREFFPQYDHLTDYELTRAAHAKEAPDVPYEQFAQSFGGPLREDAAEVAARQYNAANPENPITAQDIRNKDRSGFSGGIRLLAEGIYDAVTDQFPEDLARVWRGGDIDPNNSGAADRIIRRQMKDSAARIPSLQEAEGSTLANSLYQGPKSIATSMATGIAGSVIGGAAGGAAGTVAPGAGNAAGAILGSMVGGATLSGAAF